LDAISLAVAFGAGVISITSPCCLPLLPGYLAYLSGMSIAEAQAAARRRTVIAATLFVAGFSLVFMALGATASQLGALLLNYRFPLSRIAGVLILVMGLVLVLEARVGWLSRGGDWSRWAPGGRLWTAPVLGAAFAITWTPCIGPVLAAILTLAGTTAQLQQGVVLLAAYSLGLGVPFVALSLSVPGLRSIIGRIGRGTALVQGVAGVLLAAVGALLLTDRWLPLISPVLAWYAQARWPPI